jgi:CO/xanthine dehydrogenase FAD-binding subunit
VKPAPFEYHRPRTVDEALRLLAERAGEAKPLAGGQSLIPAMNFRLARPTVLVDLNGVSELSYIAAADGELRIGAMTRQRAVERSADVARLAPLLHETMPFIAHPQIRNRGTIGGSLAHADPAAELPAVAVALGARFRVRSPDQERWIPAADFFAGLFTTTLEPGELLVEIAIPDAPPRTGFAFDEVARRHGDYALAGAAAMVTLDAKNRCAEARIALLSVGEGPVLAVKAADKLQGEKPSEKLFKAVGQTAAEKDIDPPGDIQASAEYRRHLVGAIVRRVVERAVQRGGKPA